MESENSITITLNEQKIKALIDENLENPKLKKYKDKTVEQLKEMFLKNRAVAEPVIIGVLKNFLGSVIDVKIEEK